MTISETKWKRALQPNQVLFEPLLTEVSGEPHWHSAIRTKRYAIEIEIIYFKLIQNNYNSCTKKHYANRSMRFSNEYLRILKWISLRVCCTLSPLRRAYSSCKLQSAFHQHLPKLGLLLLLQHLLHQIPNLRCRRHVPWSTSHFP